MLKRKVFLLLNWINRIEEQFIINDNIADLKRKERDAKKEAKEAAKEAEAYQKAAAKKETAKQKVAAKQEKIEEMMRIAKKPKNAPQQSRDQVIFQQPKQLLEEVYLYFSH